MANTFFVIFAVLGVIHGDYNEQNLLVAKCDDRQKDSPHEEHDIVGVIDFGDMSETCYVFEVRKRLEYRNYLHPPFCPPPPK